ncbi:MAG TPA: SLBB domain-containing protein, partial [Coleofasciculaceae cyanobacterium]
FPDEEVRPETVPLRPGMTRAEAAKVIYQALADQGRVAPLATLVATQNQPFNSANATANPSNSAGAIANPLSPSQPNSLPSPQPNPQPDQVGAASPAATNLTATPSSVNAGSENPANLEAVVQPGPQPVNPLVEPTVEPSPQPVNALIEPTAEPSPQPADLPESAASPRPAVGSAMPAAAPTASIVVAGEVSHPGAYSLDANATRQPTLIQAIQMAGGVTTKANIRQIQVHRGTTILPLDLWQLLQSGDLGKDIVLQPGDMISVPRAAELSSARKERVPPTPAQIQVSVVGEVKKPGRLRLPSNTSVNQAILASGGFNRQTQKAELIRLNTNGTIARRVLTVDLAQGTNESSNPRLQNNDVILVQHTGTATIASGRVALPTLISILPTTPAHNRAAL